MLPTLESSTVAKVDPRVKRTRKLLLDAFMSLIAEKSFEEITVQDIATRATVNRATFYAHFVDKYALVDSLIREGFAQLLQRRLATPTDSAQEHLRQVFLAVTDHWAALHGQCKHNYRMFDSLVEAQVKGQLRDSVCSWLLEHGPHAHNRQRVDLAATIISWAIYGAALEWTQRAGAQSAEAFADEALPLIAASIAALGS
jgi:AcrR family transcriptional regulator